MALQHFSSQLFLFLLLLTVTTRLVYWPFRCRSFGLHSPWSNFERRSYQAPFDIMSSSGCLWLKWEKNLAHYIHHSASTSRDIFAIKGLQDSLTFARSENIEQIDQVSCVVGMNPPRTSEVVIDRIGNI